ncbi:MAG TPA: Na+/H+ antiporter, partial [Pasteurellaceae bacterium]|nr:Na+/H+ antiporter [Pasteurellaceae bacterium]
MQLVDFSSSVWSIVPALLALGLAIITRKVLLSLSVGIIVGALMLTGGNVLDTLVYLKDTFISLIYNEEGLNSNNVNIILFLLLLGILTALLTVSGSNQA